MFANYIMKNKVDTDFVINFKYPCFRLNRVGFLSKAVSIDLRKITIEYLLFLIIFILLLILIIVFYSLIL